MRTTDGRDRRQLALMVLPYAVGLLVLIIAPFGVSAVLAFTDFDLIGAPEWVGIDNFRALAADPVFRIALTNSFVFAAIAVPARMLIALGLALLLHRRAAAVGTARMSVALPAAVPDIAYGLLWLWLFNPAYGPINQILTIGGRDGSTVLGGAPPQWLTLPNHARAAIIVMSLFVVGETFLVLLAVRRSLPPDVYELAAVEGAGAWQVFRRVTLPLMAPVLALLTIRDTIQSFHFSFVPALVVTEGGPPQYATTYLSMFVYRNAFEYLRYGYAAAATLVMLGLTVAAVLLQVRLFRRYGWPASGGGE